MALPIIASILLRFLGFCMVAVFGISAELPSQKFSIPAAPAEKSLKMLSVQSGRQVLFPTDTVAGIRTNSISGQMTAAAALNKMLAGTALIGVEDEKTGSLTVRRYLPPAGKTGGDANGRSADPKKKSPAKKYSP